MAFANVQRHLRPRPDDWPVHPWSTHFAFVHGPSDSDHQSEERPSDRKRILAALKRG